MWFILRFVKVNDMTDNREMLRSYLNGTQLKKRRCPLANQDQEKSNIDVRSDIFCI